MPTLYIVPTPIGNLQDITLRSIEILQSVDFILAEDTRHSAKLLKHLNIQKPLISFHQHNEHKKLEEVTDKITQSESAALVSDAGTPGISDPGFLLVRACIEHNIDVITLPGPTAFVPALVNSGLPCDKFVFEGFLPHKKGRQTRLQLLAEEKRTIIFYESPYRLLKTLEQLTEFFGKERKASVSREISKIHEETVRGTIQELINHFSDKKIKGEIVLVVSGKES
ncbi:MAG TPA: 16S rRNA (cytidine(1402)-2'-O)-methyltransferase [Flavobacteriales bacterium]|nr:16S rRNA (cytidine(1402)-2'-O)-methyltransferase [Flavobacteriales bacterium]|tara:strand:- start:67792 stop:68466 length:675 start_codon:yes stop_codon:yes gene_type:complete